MSWVARKAQTLVGLREAKRCLGLVSEVIQAFEAPTFEIPMHEAPTIEIPALDISAFDISAGSPTPMRTRCSKNL